MQEVRVSTVPYDKEQKNCRANMNESNLRIDTISQLHSEIRLVEMHVS